MTRPLKICIFTPTFYPAIGGAENAADQIARGLTRRGHKVNILTARQAKPAPPLPYPIHYYRRPPKQHLWPEVISWTLAKHHKRHPFDVILAFYSYPTGYAATYIKHKLNTPVVISPRGEDLYLSSSHLKKLRVKNTTRKGYQNADQIVAISKWIAERVETATNNNHPTITVAYNGIDFATNDQLIEQSRLTQPNLPVNKPFLLHLARLVPVKGHHIAIEAVRLLQDFFRKQNIQYAIVGQGRCIDNITSSIKKHNLGDIIKILGPRIGIEKAWLLDNASLFITTSREEALGTVSIEAMAASLPIVASDIPVHRELIEQRNLGKLFEDGNPQSLADAIQTMLAGDMNTYKQNMQQARMDFTLDKMIDAYENACIKALKISGD